jgi:hypothetical protein
LIWCEHAYPDADMEELSRAYIVHTNDVNGERFPPQNLAGKSG